MKPDLKTFQFAALAALFFITGCASGSGHRVVIKSIPNGAVIVSGNDHYLSPANVRLKDEKVNTVTVSLAGYETQTLTLDGTKDYSEPVMVTLEKSYNLAEKVKILQDMRGTSGTPPAAAPAPAAAEAPPQEAAPVPPPVQPDTQPPAAQTEPARE